MRWIKASQSRFRFARALRHGVLVCLTLAGVSRAFAQPDAGPPRALRPPSATPPIGDFEVRARQLFEAILHDDPKQANDVFFPRDAFLLIKAMPSPGRYYDKLHARFEQDIHALHKSIARDAQYDRFELAKRGGYVKPGEEGNHLPYWAARHCFLHYREHGQRKKLEVRVLITWQERWYLIHLNEFH